MDTTRVEEQPRSTTRKVKKDQLKEKKTLQQLDDRRERKRKLRLEQMTRRLDRVKAAQVKQLELLQQLRIPVPRH